VTKEYRNIFCNKNEKDGEIEKERGEDEMGVSSLHRLLLIP
jgi:hypothetical protein